MTYVQYIQYKVNASLVHPKCSTADPHFLCHSLEEIDSLY